MPVRELRVTARCGAAPTAIWTVAREFAAPWHPMVAEMTREVDATGHVLRAFRVKGEDTLYRERLTWFSDSEMSMGHTHVAGIDGVDSYDARLSVAGAGEGAAVTMSARFSAPTARADAIAEGTRAVFEAGTEALAGLGGEGAVPDVMPGAVPSEVPIRTRMLDDLPRLALSHVEGPGRTLCLFLHGIGGNRGNWDGQLRAVAPVMRAAAIDLRGYGDSTLGAAQSTVDDHCADILRVMEAFDAPKLVLCGLSYGAWIATSFAMRHPDRLAALVLAGGCTGMSEAGPDERENFRLSREVPMDAGRSPADFAESVVEVISGPGIGATEREMLLDSMRAIPTETYRDALRCFTNPLEKFDFTRLTMPVLLMTGQHDRLAPPHEIKQVAERIFDASPVPDVRYECLSGAGHVCNLEAPGAFNAPLLDLLERMPK